VVTGAEISATGIYVKYWFLPSQRVTAAVVLLALLTANHISVKLFGEFEFWLFVIEVVTIILVIALGLSIILFARFGDVGQTATFANVWSHGGLFPHGMGATLLALQIVMCGYLGVELVGMTAQVKNPEEVLPRAIKSVAVRTAVLCAGRMLRTLAPGTGGVPPAQQPACSRGGHHRVGRDARHRRGAQRGGLAVNVIGC
jgi:L-asparagine transporter-like permease